MPRHMTFGLIFFGLVLALGMAYYYNLQKRISQLVHPVEEISQPFVMESPPFSESALMKEVMLFFPSKTREGLLEPEQRKIHSSDQVSAEAKQIIVELIAGSNEGRGAALPAETKLREVFLVGKDLAIVDLTQEVSVHHPGGLTQEVSSIYAIVNSLTRSLPSIQKVQILIEGAEVETLAGHIDLTHPFSQDLSLTSLSPTSGKDPSEAKADALETSKSGNATN